ncbi:MAG TPA: hypothetical protein DC038_02520 [Clostridiales bacterium]|nr:hypothetical protein [Clostridiales bacterium]
MKIHKLKILSICIVIAFSIALYIAVENTQESNEIEKYNILKDAIIKNAVLCYAIEGFYPPSIKYLEDNYGLVVNHDKYVVSYRIFASNIMPGIEIYLK